MPTCLWVIFGLLSLIFLLTLSPLSVLERTAGWLSFPSVRGVCGHCSRLWRQQSCRWWTTPLIPLCFLYRRRQSSQFASLLLSCMSLCQERRKEGEAGGVLRARRGFFLYALLLDKKPASNMSRWLKKLYIRFKYVLYLWQRWELKYNFLYDSLSPCLGTTRWKIAATDKIRM